MHKNENNSSFDYTIKINNYIENGNYFLARKLLEEKYYYNSVVLNQLYGLLETVENNYYRSKKYYNNCLGFRKRQLSTLLSLAKTHIQLGDYDIAKEILVNLQRKDKYYFRATINLIYLNILVNDYEQAYYLLENLKEIPDDFMRNYLTIKSYLLNALGKNNLLDNSIYTIKRIINNDNEDLIEHVKKHVNLENEFLDDKFVANIDLNKLVKVVSKEILKLNPCHFEIADIYRFKLNEPIGYKNKSLTNDIAIVTLLNTKKIITMYPVKLSKEFDIEQNALDEKLKLKRQNKLF